MSGADHPVIRAISSSSRPVNASLRIADLCASAVENLN
jgi:hypothetical protein